MYRADRPNDQRDVPLRRAPEEVPPPRELPVAGHPLSPRDVVALQSYAGNASVSRMLSRQPDGPTSTPTPTTTGDAGAAPADPENAGKYKEAFRNCVDIALGEIHAAVPFIQTISGHRLDPYNANWLMTMRNGALPRVQLAMDMIQQAFYLRKELGFEPGAAGGSDADQQIDLILLQLTVGHLPLLVMSVETFQGGIDNTMSTLRLLYELRLQMALARLGALKPPPPAPPATPPPATPPPAPASAGPEPSVQAVPAAG